MKHIFALLVLLAAANSACLAQVTDLPPTGPQPIVLDEAGNRFSLYSGSHALLISQRSYLGVSKNGWRPLDATVREMDAVADSLRKHGFSVRRATDLNSSDLITVFRDFMADFGYQSNNRLLFFFSGHGYTNPQNDMGYLVPVDALDPNIDPRKFYSRAVPIETIQTWARELTARHVLFLFDSCFSGSIFLSRASVTSPDSRGATVSDRLTFFRGTSGKPVRQFIAAGGPKEELPATSVFVPLLIEGLDGRASRNNDGYITGKELGLWLEQTLPRYRQNQNPHSGVIRQPELSFGDMVFQLPVRAQTAQVSQPQTVAIAPPTVQPSPAVTGAVPRPAAVQEKVTFAADGYFDTSKSILKTDTQAKLSDLVRKTQGTSLEVIIAVGHTDSVEAGSVEARQRLSVARAEAVKAQLVGLGIERNRVYTEGKGSSQPVADNSNADGRSKNRRVEVEVVGTRTRQ
jgi:outer membrane protein OmpA-like peptidoglycan-associated protein